MEAGAEGVAIVGQAPVNRGNRVKKRSLRNKALSVTFDEKDLKDYVGGFHKRKKKRRKEAEKKQQEAERRRRLADRKKRRLDREFALYGGAPPPTADEDLEQDDESELNPSVSGTTMYDNGDVTVTVTTSEINREEVEDASEKKAATPLPSVPTGGAAKKHNIPVSKKKPFKKQTKGRSRTKLSSKRDRRKAKTSGSKKRH